MNQIEIPGRIFLDTSVVNFILEYGEQIHDGAPIPKEASIYQRRDIDALYNIFLTGQRALWQFAVSSLTYQEIIKTKETNKKQLLCDWLNELWDYWQNIVQSQNDLPTPSEAMLMRDSIISYFALDVLPDIDDRNLLAEALMYKCDCFCTRDWNTILKRRKELIKVNILILTPFELWEKIEPFSSLWV